MRRRALPIVLATTCTLVFAGAPATARTQQPGVTIYEACDIVASAPYGVGYEFTGGEPGEIVSVVTYYDGDFIVGVTAPLDAQGRISGLPFDSGRATPLGIVTIRVFANPDELPVFPVPDPSLRLLAEDRLAHPCEGRPQPSTKDACKNGGWRSFGVFENQGDCVSFVATRGTNPPGR